MKKHKINFKKNSIMMLALVVIITLGIFLINILQDKTETGFKLGGRFLLIDQNEMNFDSKASKKNKLIRHYDKTLESWLERLLANKSKVKDLFDEKFVKCYEYYMASCEAAFKYRDLVVFQLQIVKNFNNAKRTRNYLYS